MQNVWSSTRSYLLNSLAILSKEAASKYDSLITIDELLVTHLKTNLFPSDYDKMNFDYKYIDIYKQTSKVGSLNYSSLCLYSVMQLMKQLESQINNESNDITLDNFTSEKMRPQSEKKSKNVLDYFIEKILLEANREVYEENSVMNNYTVQNKLCLALFLINVFVVKFAFLFDKKELSKIMTETKRFKEY